MLRRLTIVFILAGCGAGSAGPIEPTTPPRARTDTGLRATDRGRPAPQRVARSIEAVPRDESPARRLCADPSFHGGDLVIGGERVRLRSTCPTDWPLSPGLPVLALA